MMCGGNLSPKSLRLKVPRSHLKGALWWTFHLCLLGRSEQSRRMKAGDQRGCWGVIPPALFLWLQQVTPLCQTARHNLFRGIWHCHSQLVWSEIWRNSLELCLFQTKVRLHFKWTFSSVLVMHTSRLVVVVVITFIIKHYSLLRSRLTAPMLHVILNDCSLCIIVVLNSYQSDVLTALFGCYMVSAMWNYCHLSTSSLYTIEPCTKFTVSLHSKPHRY